MDPDKKQDLVPDETPETPGAGSSQPNQHTPPPYAPQPADPTPDRPHQPSSPVQPTGAYGQQSPPSSPKRKIIIGLAVLVVLAAATSASAYFLQSREATKTTAPRESQSAEQGVKKPGNWKVVDTKLGFKVKAPSSWSDAGSLPTNASIGNVTSKTITIGETDRDAASIFGNYVAVSTQSLKNSKSQSEFEREVTNKKFIAGGLGVGENQLKLASAKTDINGKQWLRVDIQASGQFFETILYLWVDDHAISLNVLGSKQSELDKLVNDYLLPMAASVKLD